MDPHLQARLEAFVQRFGKDELSLACARALRAAINQYGWPISAAADLDRTLICGSAFHDALAQEIESKLALVH